MKALCLLLLVTITAAREVKRDVFAVNLIQKLDETHGKGNLVFSPFSLETVLALTAVGAKGETAEQLKKVTGLPSSDEKIKSETQAFRNELEKEKNIVVSSANGVYLAKGLQAEPQFIKTATENFGAGVENIDFGASENAANKINSWVEKETHGKIKNLVSADKLSILTRMVLVNSLYFKGNWEVPFDREDTTKKDFHVSKGETIQVDTMELLGSVSVYRSDEGKVTLLRMPYAGTHDKAALVIILTDEIDGLDQLEKHLGSQVASEVNFTRRYVKLSLPKFRIEDSIDFKPVLKKMGITHIFSSPDLSGITKEAIEVASINQKVFIDVNEDGTEAAASTAVIGNARTLVVEKPTEYRVDHPFMFYLEYNDVPLISGRLVNPLHK